MIRRSFFVFPLIVFLSQATPAQVPSKEKAVAGAERAFEKVAKAYLPPHCQIEDRQGLGVRPAILQFSEVMNRPRKTKMVNREL